MQAVLLEKLAAFIGVKNAKLLVQLTRYFMVAAVGLVFDFATLITLTEMFGVNYLLAAVIGFLIGLTINYLLSTRYVFKNSKIKSRYIEFGLYAVVGLIGLGILSASMWLLTDILHIHYIFSKCLATVIVYLWNFFGRKAMYSD